MSNGRRRRRRMLLWTSLAAAAAGLAGYRASSGPPPPDGAVAARAALLVRTLAGEGAPGVQDGPGVRARFADPFGVAAGRDGTLYVADAGESNRVRRIAPDGTVTTLAGSSEGFMDGAGAAASLHTPSGIALDQWGNLYVADTGNHAIRRITPAGHVRTLAGTGEPGHRDGPGAQARFDGPVGVAVHPDGSVYVADTYNDRVRRIAPDGHVTTLAGTGTPGHADGEGHAAQFDTPAGIAAGPGGDLFVADTGNDAVRRIRADGSVTTVGIAPFGQGPVLGPVGIAAGRDGTVYVTDRRGFIVAIAPGGEASRVAGAGHGFSDGDAGTARFTNPTGVALDLTGALIVADAGNYLVRRVAPRPPPSRWSLSFLRSLGAPAAGAAALATPAGEAPRLVHEPAVPRLTPGTLGLSRLPWPIAPQSGWHEVAGTMGEPRGSLGGDGRERFHAGIDVRGDYGAVVRAVRSEKVQGVAAAAAFDQTSETIALDLMAYTHLRVGRDARNRLLDPGRFILLYDERGRPVRVRVRRGTRFVEGDALGTINRASHTHLDVGPRGAELNPLALPLVGFRDRVAPTIAAGGIRLYGPGGALLERDAAGRVPVSGPVSIVVEAYDQVDDNLPRRRLGLFELGYQVLNSDGTPARGFAEPRMTLRFDRLPPDPLAPLLAYAEGSGITVYGSPVTRFLYIVTNTVRPDRVEPGEWDPAPLAPGDYVLRIVAADYSGNVAVENRDVRIVIP